MSRTKSATSGIPSVLRRRWKLLALLLLVAAAAVILIWQRGKSADPAAALRFATVEKGNLEKTVTAVGSLKAKDYVDVGTQVSGRVLNIHVEIGDKVAKGELIAEIDPTVYASTVAKDRANLDNLKAQLAQREAELALADQQAARNGRLASGNAVSQDVVQQAEASARVAAAALNAVKAQIKAAEATLEGDLANLNFTKIYAPMDGTVVVQDTRRGQTVNSVQSVAVIAQVANLDVMTVWAQVAEADVSSIKPNMSAYFTTLGAPERRWVGKVRQVQPTPTTTNDVVLYNVLVDVDNHERALLPAMTVQAFFVLAEARDAVVVPLGALKPDPEARAFRNAAGGGGPGGAPNGERRRRDRGTGERPPGDGAGRESAAGPAAVPRDGAGPGAGANQDQGPGADRKAGPGPAPAEAETGVAAAEPSAPAEAGDRPRRRGIPYRVQVKTAEGLEWRSVRVGLATRTEAEVLSGLEVGEEIVVGEKGALPAAGSARAAPRMPGGAGPRL